jgi:hypothetical protein
VSINFSKEFAMQVSWQKIDAQTGAAIEEEDITQDTPDNPGGDGNGGDNGGNGQLIDDGE